MSITQFKSKWSKLSEDLTHYESYPWESSNETREYRGKPWYVKGNPFVCPVGFEVCEK